jgi:hypothetical protein
MIVVTALAAAAALLLLWAGVEHVWRPDVAAEPLGTLLSRGRGTSRLAGRVLAGGEVVVATAALIALTRPVPGGRWAVAALGAVYLAFFCYLLLRFRRHDRGDCGCTGIGARVGTAGLVRSGSLGTLAIGAAVTYPDLLAIARTPDPQASALVLAAAVTLAVLLYALPPAVDGLSVQRHRRRRTA